MPIESDYTVPALYRGLKILELFDGENRVLTTNDFASHLSCSNAAIYRIVITLTEMNYLRKIARNTYELGPQVISRGFSYLASRDLVDIVKPHITELRDSTSMSCHLSIREGTDSIYIYRAFAAQRLTVNIPIGTRLPCHITAMGRILLTQLDDSGLESLYRNISLDGYGTSAPRSLPELKMTIREDAQRGWVEHRSDYATAIAAGIIDHTGTIIGAINISGPDAILTTEARRSDIRNALLDTAQRINAELGSVHD